MWKGSRNWLLGAVVIVLAALSPKLFAAFDAAKPAQVQPAPTIVNAVSTTHTDPNDTTSGLVRYDYDFAGSSGHWKAEITEFDSMLSSAAANSPVSHAVQDFTLTYTGDRPEAVGSVDYALRYENGGYIHESAKGIPLNPSHSVHSHNADASYAQHSSGDAMHITVTWNGHTEELALPLKNSHSSQTKSNQAGIVVHSLQQFQSLVNKVKTEHPGVDPAGQEFADIEKVLQKSAAARYLGQSSDWNAWAQYLADSDEIVYLPDTAASGAGADVVINRAPAESFSCLTQEITYTSEFILRNPPKPNSGQYNPSIQKDAFGLVFSNVTNPGKDLLSNQFYVGADAQDTGSYFLTHPVSNGHELALLNIGHGEILQSDNNGIQTRKYFWDKGIAQVTFTPNWHDHGTVFAIFAHAWNQAAIHDTQLQPSGGSVGLEVVFTGGADHFTASSPKGNY